VEDQAKKGVPSLPTVAAIWSLRAKAFTAGETGPRKLHEVPSAPADAAYTALSAPRSGRPP
jgi:hypothetical protein